MAAATVSVDEFQALEQKVLQTVELIKMERASRAAFEAEAKTARQELADVQAQLVQMTSKVAERDAQLAGLHEQLAAAGTATQVELEGLQREREAVKLRVEKMLASLDELL
jgi:predicted  nucleic acid-binding Zn-ribbon protein